VAFYSLLLVIEMFLMIRFARLGPSSLHTGRYHFERDVREARVASAQPSGLSSQPGSV
jgi:cytochrome d ubiquinol oxidase subunit I